MAAPAGERQRLVLAGIALVASALVVLGLREVASARVLEAKALPTTDLMSLSAYFRPLGDTSNLAGGSAKAIVISRDPFVTSGVARSEVPFQTTLDTQMPKPAGGGQWVVSTILFEGSRKSAIVNNAWVTVGDTLGGGSRLTAVERDHIVVTDAKGIRHEVPIQGGEAW